MSSREVYIVSACRTPIGDLGGHFKNLRAVDLALPSAVEAVSKAGIEKDMVDDVIWGECHQQLDQCNTARVMAARAGIPKEISGITINKVCTSAMQALIYATQTILLGDSDIVLAGGVESMSSAPYVLRTARWGQRLQHGKMLDNIFEGFTCAVANMIMGNTAENLAEKYNISREDQDEIALRSHIGAAEARKNGRFKDEIVPVTIPQRKGDPIVVENDEHPRDGLTMADLAKLPTVFKKDGTVTAGNASGICDGSAAMILMSGERMKKLGLKPLAKVSAYALAGVEAELMGYGPVPAMEKVLEKSGNKMSDIDLVEINEAFAAQYIACEKILELDRNICNVNGSGIALGHPVGSTGTRITVTLLHEMIKRDAKKGIASLCGMGGVATAILIERD